MVSAYRTALYDGELRELNDIMEFDHVIRVLSDGSVVDVPEECTPTLHEGELSDQRWYLYTRGYSGQYDYSGPVMHDSEFIGGTLADDILSEPGVYVALQNELDDPRGGSMQDGTEGWAIAKLYGSE
jgi:hypothetical protein